MHVVDSYVHVSTVRLEGQFLCFWISLDIIGGVAFENFAIGVLLGKILGRALSARIGFLRAHKHSKVRRANLLVLNQS